MLIRTWRWPRTGWRGAILQARSQSSAFGCPGAARGLPGVVQTAGFVLAKDGGRIGVVVACDASLDALERLVKGAIPSSSFHKASTLLGGFGRDGAFRFVLRRRELRRHGGASCSSSKPTASRSSKSQTAPSVRDCDTTRGRSTNWSSKRSDSEGLAVEIICMRGSVFAQ